LLAHEGAASSQDARANTAAGRVYDKLQLQMGPLLGVAGVHLLFMRSAKLESSTKLRERLQAQDPAVATESAAALFGTFLTLSTAFIGERLTTQVLRNAWPTFEKIETREKHK